MAVVKATLYHLDGHSSEIVMTLPFYTRWAEFLETGMNALRDYVFELTRHWIKISHFVMVMGWLDENGTIHAMNEPTTHEIPLGLFYQCGNRGKCSTTSLSPQI